jgi:predicted amidohydrolase YtcJ
VTATSTGPASLIFGNARFLDPSGLRWSEVLQAVATRGDRIVATGPAPDVFEWYGRGTELVDLDGACVTPGLIDTHTHLALYGLRHTTETDASADGDDLLAALAARVRETPAGTWIRGGGWTGAIAERSALDAVAPAHPVVLMHATGHLLAANGAALRAARIGRDTAVPAGGAIDRDGTGEPTGVIRELPAMALLTAHVPPPSAAELDGALAWAQDQCLAEGVTATKETYDAGDCGYAAVTAAYARLDAAGRLRIRPQVLRQVRSAADVREAAAASPPPPGVKVYLDGSLVARTAWLNAPYARVPDETGAPVLDPEAFADIVAAAEGADLALAVHAIGDRAVDIAAAAFRRHISRRRLRHTIVHALLVSPQGLRDIVAAGVAVETQPAFLDALGAGYARALGRERLRDLLPLRTLLAAGVTVGAGSDSPTCPPVPRTGLWAAVTRVEPDCFGTAEAATPAEALRAYTSHAARCLGAEGELGALVTGARADLVAWDTDLLSATGDELRSVRPVMTVAGGEVQSALVRRG